MLSSGRKPYIEQGLFQHVDPSDHDKDINLCHVEFTTPVQEVIIQVGNLGLSDHLEDVLSYVHVIYYFCTHCSETLGENHFHALFGEYKKM
jgi:hypothetical protein